MSTHHHARCHPKGLSLFLFFFRGQCASHRIAAPGMGHDHAQPFPVWQFLSCLCEEGQSATSRRDECSSNLSLPCLRAAWAKQHGSYRTTESRMLWIPRSAAQYRTPRTPAPCQAAQAGIRNSQGHLDH
ncbi:hypothetical protein B0T18DRAFT_418103, partial [Schizothecium vesticola]